MACQLDGHLANRLCCCYCCFCRPEARCRLIICKMSEMLWNNFMFLCLKSLLKIFWEICNRFRKYSDKGEKTARGGWGTKGSGREAGGTGGKGRNGSDDRIHFVGILCGMFQLGWASIRLHRMPRFPRMSSGNKQRLKVASNSFYSSLLTNELSEKDFKQIFAESVQSDRRQAQESFFWVPHVS